MSTTGREPPEAGKGAATAAPGARGSRLAVLVAGIAAAAAVAFVAARAVSPPSRPPAARAAAPAAGRPYLGVYAPGAPQTYRAVAGFARAVGRRPDLVGYFGGWAQPFAIRFARQARRNGAVPLVQLDPTYASVQQIAAGAYDGYLREFAGRVRGFGQPVVIGFGHEMNAPWYSWGYGHVPAATFVAAWRHIVTLFGAQGARNVTWLWTVNAGIAGTGPLTAWWPGPRFVTWVGIDGYYYRPSATFASVFAGTIRQVRAFTAKPILLSETAVGPAAGQPAKIADLFAGMRRYHTLGLVWFDMRQHQGIYHQDWRLEDHPAAAAAFRRAARTDLRPAGAG